MEEDLGKDEIVLKEKKPRSEAQIKAFEKAREIRLENAKIKKEKIAQVKEEVKNRNKVEELKVPPTTPSFQGQSQDLRPVEEPKINKARGHRGTAVPLIEESDEEQVVVIKKKKKPKVIYIEESDEEPEVIKKKKEQIQPLVIQKPQPSIRFC
jgi:hypothetical protein